VKPLWAVKNERKSGKSADGRIEYSLEIDYGRRSGNKIIIEVAENENKENAKSVESKTAAKFEKSDKECIKSDEWRCDEWRDVL
jgi:hypothetical protein